MESAHVKKIWEEEILTQLQSSRFVSYFYPLFKSFKRFIFQQLQLMLYLSTKSSLEKVRLAKNSYPSFHPRAQIICLSCSTYEKRVLMHFENNLDFKATWIFHWFTMSHSLVLAHFVSHKKTTSISKQLMNFTFWLSKKARITRKHNEIRFEYEKTSNGWNIIFTKDMQSQHN